MRQFWHNLLFALFATGNLSAENVSLVADEEMFLFGGRSTSVHATVRNDGPERHAFLLDWQLYQSSTATIAPVGKRTSLGEREFPARQESIVRFAVEPPEVRTITSFIIKLWVEGKELGQVRVTVCPTNIFSQLKGLGIDVQEPAELLATLLNPSKGEVDRKLSIVRLPSGQTDWNRNELAPAVLFIVSPGVQGFERLMPMKVSTEERLRVGILQDWFVPELEKSALSQLRLLRAIDLMVKPDQARPPGFSK